MCKLNMTTYLWLRVSLVLLVAIIQPFASAEPLVSPNTPQFAKDFLDYSQAQVWATAKL